MRTLEVGARVGQAKAVAMTQRVAGKSQTGDAVLATVSWGTSCIGSCLAGALNRRPPPVARLAGGAQQRPGGITGRQSRAGRPWPVSSSSQAITWRAKSSSSQAPPNKAASSASSAVAVQLFRLARLHRFHGATLDEQPLAGIRAAPRRPGGRPDRPDSAADGEQLADEVVEHGGATAISSAGFRRCPGTAGGTRRQQTVMQGGVGFRQMGQERLVHFAEPGRGCTRSAKPKEKPSTGSVSAIPIPILIISH